MYERAYISFGGITSPRGGIRCLGHLMWLMAHQPGISGTGAEVEEIRKCQQVSRLLGSQVGHEEVTKLSGSLIEVVTHALSTNTLADNVEVEAGKDELVICINGKEKGGQRMLDAYLFSLIM